MSDGEAPPRLPAVVESDTPRARFVSLRFRLLGLVMLVLVPWLALVLYAQVDERKAAIANVKRDAMRVLDIVTHDQAAQIEGARQLLTTFARLPQLRSSAACAPLLAELLKAYSQYRNFVVVDANGNITCGAVPMSAEVELAVTRAHLDIARQIQQSLLPQDPLDVGRIRVAGRCVPAAAVGGDYFGYFPRSGDGFDSFVGDVAGHGVGAALLMAEARTTFLTERLGSSSAADTLAKLNALLYDDLDRAKMFMTACCATFDATKRELSYANAGHPPAILLRSGETQCTRINADGVLLGIDKDARFAETNVKLHGGDIVVFYTDGITERSNATGELFGADRLNELVVAHRDATPEAMIDAVFEVVKSVRRCARTRGRFDGCRDETGGVTFKYRE